MDETINCHPLKRPCCSCVKIICDVYKMQCPTLSDKALYGKLKQEF